MPTCQNCQTKWSWWQTLKRSFVINGGMMCPYCGERQYITPRARKISMLITFTAPAIILLKILFDFSHIFLLFALLGSLPLLIGIFPLFLELSNKDQPLW